MKPFLATAIAYNVDERGNLYIRLLDGTGTCFAAALMPTDGALLLGDFIHDKFVEDEDTIGEVAGNA